MKIVIRLKKHDDKQELHLNNRGPVRGGSGGSIDPPKILENNIKEFKIELLS